jgi:tetratricopeptide (TPR) repeat protein
MHDVFISYTRADHAAAEAIAHRFSAVGFSVFFDQAALVAGDSWSSKIEKELRGARVVLALLSSNSRRSTWVADELQTALDSKKLVVPVLLDPGAKENWLWPLLANRQSVALYLSSPNWESQLDHLVQTLTQTIGKEEAPRLPVRARRRLWMLSAVALALVLVIFVVAAIFQAAHQRQIETKLAEDRALAAQKQAETAKHELQGAREASKFLRRGINEVHRHRYAEAVQLYDNAIALDPNNPVVHDLRGYALYLQGMNEQAAKALEHAVELSPSYAWGHYDLALVYWRLGRKVDAVREVKRAIEIDSNFRKTIQEDDQFAQFRSSAAFRELMKVP